MDAAAVLIATVKLRPGMDAEFTAWKAHSDLVIGKFPGFVGSDMLRRFHVTFDYAGKRMVLERGASFELATARSRVQQLSR